MAQPVYATVDDLTDFMAPDTPPTNAAKLLRVASRRVDTLLIGAVYPVDDAGRPTDTDHMEALRDAACAQAEFATGWQQQTGGDSTGAKRRPTAVTVGQVSYSYGGRPSSGGSGSADDDTRVPTSSEVVDILRLAGLLPVTPITY